MLSSLLRLADRFACFVETVIDALFYKWERYRLAGIRGMAKARYCRPDGGKVPLHTDLSVL